MNIELDIDELVLHGVALKDRILVGDAVQRELTRLLERRGVPRILEQGGDVPELQGAALHLSHDTSPRALGREIATSVYGSLGTT
jgi:hypothetical protein